MKNMNPVFKLVQSSVIYLPTPSSITVMWNYGSLLGLCLMIQIASGLFLAMHYASDVSLAFYSVNHIMRDVNYGWILRCVHANGASFFFICIYMHMARGLYFGSYYLMHVWMIGCTILLATMATAFLGYVLPWGQMSFWGATVITNLFSAIPYVGNDIVYWMWGGFAVDNATLTRFFSLHFILPFVISLLSIIHLFFLHLTGSSNPTGLNTNLDKIKFDPYFSIKDLFGVMMMLSIFMFVVVFEPWTLGDPENFVAANPLVTPVHIQPEWYFLFAYAILRSIPNKLGGVLALFAAVLMFYSFPFLYQRKYFKSNCFLPCGKLMFWIFISLFVLLTWIGARPVEHPYVIMGQLFTILYFSWTPLYFFINSYWSKLI